MVDEAEEVSSVEVRLAAVVPDIQLEAGLDQFSLNLLTGGSPARALLEVSLHQTGNLLRYLINTSSNTSTTSAGIQTSVFISVLGF